MRLVLRRRRQRQARKTDAVLTSAVVLAVALPCAQVSRPRAPLSSPPARSRSAPPSRATGRWRCWRRPAPPSWVRRAGPQRSSAVGSALTYVAYALRDILFAAQPTPAARASASGIARTSRWARRTRSSPATTATSPAATTRTRPPTPLSPRPRFGDLHARAHVAAHGRVRLAHAPPVARLAAPCRRPQLVTAMVFAGDLTFNPVTDTLTGADGAAPP